MSTSPAQIIAGKYRVVRALGQGSFGSVFLVKHIDLGVYYALKMLKQKISAEEHFLDRFRREAEILLRFTHPGSVQLRDFGRTEQGEYYMALDYCKGDVLDDLIARDGNLSVSDTLELMLQILEVLGSAHALNVIHRDIKASNVLIERGSNGEPLVRILDFGIATLKDQLATGLSRVTLEGATVGTPDYMSPEQASGESDLDHRVDIYSAGCLMYEMLTGEVPFRGPTIMQTLLKHLTQPVPPFPKELNIPQSVFEIVSKALEKERQNRYRNAMEFRADCSAAMAALNLGSRQTLDNNLPEASAPVALESAEQPEGQNQKILCLDDNEMILQIVRHIFEKEGYQVYTATSFSLIHDYIFKEQVPSMLCDVNMPGLPGQKICKMIKQAKPQMKIILFSNMDERDLERIAASCGADSFLSKNMPPQQWITQVKKICEP